MSSSVIIVILNRESKMALMKNERKLRETKILFKSTYPLKIEKNKRILGSLLKKKEVWVGIKMLEKNVFWLKGSGGDRKEDSH